MYHELRKRGTSAVANDPSLGLTVSMILTDGNAHHRPPVSAISLVPVGI
jgi:hypothetical protein